MTNRDLSGGSPLRRGEEGNSDAPSRASCRIDGAQPLTLISADYAEDLCRALRSAADRLIGDTHLMGEIVSFRTVIERAARQIERFAAPAAGQDLDGQSQGRLVISNQDPQQ